MDTDLRYHYSYLLQVLVLSLFWVVRLKRRRYFPLRVAGCFAGLFGITAGVAYIEAAVPFSNWATFNLPYMIIMALFGVAFCVCFDIPASRGMLILLLPTTAQLCVSSISVFLSRNLAIEWYWRDIIGTAVMCVVSFFLSRVYKEVYFHDARINRVALISSYCIVLCVLVLNGFGQDIEDDIARYVLAPGYRFLMSAFVFFLIFSLLTLSRTRYEKSITEVLMKKEEDRHALTRELTELINIKYHDIKHMESSGAKRELVESDQKLLDLYGLLIDCGNGALNTVLTEKNAVCQNNDIDFTVMADGKLLDFMQPADIYSLFGNALDNAVECQLELPKEERHIRLTVKAVQDMVSIVCENTCHAKLKFDNGLPRTTKGDNGYHGFGTKSIAAVCKKFGASFRMSCDGESFTLEILIPKQD